MKRIFWSVISIGSVTIIVTLMSRFLRKWRLTKPPLEEIHASPTIRPELQGLSEAEAESRRLEGQDNVISFQPPRTRREIWRDNVLTIFNLSLFGIAFVQLFVGLPLDALISLGVAFFAIWINVFQETLSRRMLKRVEQETRPQATLIREGRVKSVDPSEIVQGDVLVVGPGDQFMADGILVSRRPILVDQSMLTGESEQLRITPGEGVLAGSICASGRAAYEAVEVGQNRFVESLVKDAPRAKNQLTPLEGIVNQVLSILLVIVAIMISLLLAHFFRLDQSVGLDVSNFTSAASVIFSLAPAGLFFMIFLNYVTGTRKLAQQGALVHRARSVESLAYTTVLCVNWTGPQTSLDIEMETLQVNEDEDRLSETRIRQILGDFARSISVRNIAIQAIDEAYQGERRITSEEMPFFSVYGWMAASFDDDDLRGVYILGEEERLESNIKPDLEQKPKDAEREQFTRPSLRQRLPSLDSIFRRTKQDGEEESSVEAPNPALNDQKAEDTLDDPNREENSKETSIFGRFFNRLGQSIRLEKATPNNTKLETEDDEREDSEVQSQELSYLFVYTPNLSPIHEPEVGPTLPQELIPLCRLHFTDQVHPETINTIRAFSESGISLKLLTSGPSDRILNLLHKAGLNGKSGDLNLVASGPKLAEMDAANYSLTLQENTVFDHLNPEQHRRIVEGLNQLGNSVVVAGSGPNDLPAMRQANLSVTGKRSSQAALSAADIVLLKEPAQSLLMVMEEGQRIVNGIIDVLKLYLTQLLYTANVILVIWGAGLGFPYQSSQGAAIALFTLTLPAIGLSLWATPGVLASTQLRRLLARFVMPAALSISIAAVFVYWFFVQSTGDWSYAQLALTHMLIYSGLMLVILVRPPIRPKKSLDARSGDPRPTVLVLVLFAAILLFTPTRLADLFFKLAPLRSYVDYLVVGLAVLAWVIILLLAWRILSWIEGRIRVQS